MFQKEQTYEYGKEKCTVHLYTILGVGIIRQLIREQIYLASLQFSLISSLPLDKQFRNYYSKMRMTKLLLLIANFLSPCVGWNVTLEPYDPIPMYAEQNLTVRLFLEAGDQEVTQPLTVSLKLSEDQSWAVTLLTDSITFDYTDIR